MKIDTFNLKLALVPSLERATQSIQPMEQKVELEGPINKTEIEQVTKSINNFLKPTNTNLQFTLHEELGEYFVAIIDEVTKEVVREIPPKKLLDIHAAMRQFVGLLVDKKI